MKTSNGGSNWDIQLNTFNSIFAIQFLDNNFGYAVGGNGVAKVFKTIDGGINWQVFSPFGTSINSFQDLSFVNSDTGWICSQSSIGGGVFKTTTGGVSWVRQLDETFRPTKLFFLNKDTGWAACNSTKLYRTINGGMNWSLQFTSAFPLEAIFFLNGNKGWIRGGPDLTGNGVSYSTNGGFNWTSSHGESGGYNLEFINDSIGYAGIDNFKINKSTDGGKIWGYQQSPIYNNLQVSTIIFDSLNAWAGGNGMVHTNDGGGTLVNIKQSGSEFPDNFKLFQNYPNPFNPKTIINYEIKFTNYVIINVSDINGKIVANLVNKKQNFGNYKIEFDGSGLSSGVYFYSLYIENQLIDTKKMVLIR
ncbi:MAG: YCF48-related protein [Ignavibacteria bacterium]